jgi:hypothetical protein
MMEHKAFSFEYEAFRNGLLPLLHDALTTSDCSELIRFINLNIEAVSDPYEGQPLTEDWATMIEPPDGHQYGDFALTKYYDPADDVGLGSSWERIQEAFTEAPGVQVSPILGSTIGPPNAPFDPGKMGAYFQSAEQVRVSLAHMQQLASQITIEEARDAVRMLEYAAQSDKGLYVTF